MTEYLKIPQTDSEDWKIPFPYERSRPLASGDLFMESLMLEISKSMGVPRYMVSDKPMTAKQRVTAERRNLARVGARIQRDSMND